MYKIQILPIFTDDGNTRDELPSAEPKVHTGSLQAWRDSEFSEWRNLEGGIDEANPTQMLDGVQTATGFLLTDVIRPMVKTVVVAPESWPGSVLAGTLGGREGGKGPGRYSPLSEAKIDIADRFQTQKKADKSTDGSSYLCSFCLTLPPWFCLRQPV